MERTWNARTIRKTPGEMRWRPSDRVAESSAPQTCVTYPQHYIGWARAVLDEAAPAICLIEGT